MFYPGSLSDVSSVCVLVVSHVLLSLDTWNNQFLSADLNHREKFNLERGREGGRKGGRKEGRKEGSQYLP